MTTSVHVVIPFDTTDFLVRINRDSTMEFVHPAVQVEYEQALAAFSGTPTTPLRLLDRWEHWPSWVLGRAAISKMATIRLAADYCKRALPAYLASFPRDDRASAVIDSLAEYARTEGGTQTGLSLAKISSLANEVHKHCIASTHRGYATGCFGRAIKYAAQEISIMDAPLNLAATSAAAAIAHLEARDLPHTPRYETPEFMAIVRREEDWQIRRFIDVVSAVRVGRSVPEFGETQ